LTNLLLLGRNNDNECGVILVNWWLIIIGNLLVQQTVSLDILVDSLETLSLAALEEADDSKDGLVSEDAEKRGKDTSGDTKEDWVKDDSDGSENTMRTNKTVTLTDWSSPTVMSVWATMTHHLWVRTAMLTRSSTTAASLEGLCAVDNLALDESDSESDSLDTVGSGLLGLAGNGVASDTTSWGGAKDADGLFTEPHRDVRVGDHDASSLGEDGHVDEIQHHCSQP